MPISCSEDCPKRLHVSSCVRVTAGELQVKAGSACQTDMQSVHDLLTAATDSVCVHSVGYTLTLFRCTSSSSPIRLCLCTPSLAPVLCKCPVLEGCPEMKVG